MEAEVEVVTTAASIGLPAATGDDTLVGGTYPTDRLQADTAPVSEIGLIPLKIKLNSALNVDRNVTSSAIVVTPSSTLPLVNPWFAEVTGEDPGRLPPELFHMK